MRYLNKIVIVLLVLVPITTFAVDYDDVYRQTNSGSFINVYPNTRFLNFISDKVKYILGLTNDTAELSFTGVRAGSSLIFDLNNSSEYSITVVPQAKALADLGYFQFILKYPGLLGVSDISWKVLNENGQELNPSSPDYLFPSLPSTSGNIPIFITQKNLNKIYKIEGTQIGKDKKYIIRLEIK